MVLLRLEIFPIQGGATDFYVNAFGDRHIAVVGREGHVAHQEAGASVQVETLHSGVMRLSIRYHSRHGTVAFGTYHNGAIHPGSGQNEWLIRQASVEIEPLEETLGGDKLVFIDIGAEGGLQTKLLPYAGDLAVTFFEPSPDSAEHLRAHWPEADVVESALLDRRAVLPLNITRMAGCSSLLEPDAEMLRRWSVAPLFDVMRTVEVACERFDDLHAAGAVAAPEALKIDVQGVELEVLIGMGELLHGVLGIELEAQFYPVYRGQKLIGDLTAYLAGYGLVLRRLEPQMTFDGDLVEVNAYFTRPVTKEMASGAVKKLALIERAWGLYNSALGRELATAFGVLGDTDPSAPLVRIG